MTVKPKTTIKIPFQPDDYVTCRSHLALSNRRMLFGGLMPRCATLVPLQSGTPILCPTCHCRVA